MRRYVGFHPLKSPVAETIPGKKFRGKSWKIPHVLFVFAWYEGLHCIRPEIVVQLVNMEKGFVWFPTIACLSKVCPTDSEFHSGTLVSVAPVSVDRFYHKFLFIMMGDLQRYCPRWVIVERSQIMYMGSCPLGLQ